jgi:hypothetical protein
MLKKMFGLLLVAALSAVYVMMFVLPLRLIAGPMLKNIGTLSTWQFLIGNAAVLPFSAAAFVFCYWGISKALILAGSLKPTLHKRLLLLVLTIAGFCVFNYIIPRFHWFFDVGAMNGFHIPPIKKYFGH